jgi:hypothetical protein
MLDARILTNFPFKALTTEADAQNRWSIVTFPVDINQAAFLPTNKKVVVLDAAQVCALNPARNWVGTK